ncbi:hypothetical protein OF829_08900 [Sphingomonas sp. LB-2]|nr:hypothetical protein [Sphingomonas caeni]MCW3847358.1 hypothetical protein [Sphingomonas caeni]
MKSSVSEAVAKIVTTYVDNKYPGRGLAALAMILTAALVALYFLTHR